MNFAQLSVLVSLPECSVSLLPPPPSQLTQDQEEILGLQQMLKGFLHNLSTFSENLLEGI